MYKLLTTVHVKSLIVLLVAGTLIKTAASVPATAAETQGGPESQTSGEPWRKTPPPIASPKAYKLPPVTDYKLANGLDVHLVEDHRVPFVTVYLGVKAGSSRESEELLGLAALTADMLTEGTSKLSSRQIADEIDFIGGGLKGSADHDFTLVVGSALAPYTERLFSVMSDVVVNPAFPESELALKKANLLQELVMKRSQPDFLLEERFAKVLFGSHPYAVVAPTPDTVQRIKRKDLQEFHETNYLPNESTLIVVGDFKESAMKDLIEKSFGKWKSGVLLSKTYPALPKLEGRKIHLVDRPGSVQASLKLGNVALSRDNPDYFPLLVTNQILGGAAHSRLFMNIREQKGYTYGAYSGFAARKQPGAFGAEAEVRTEVAAPSLQEFFYELERIRNVKVSDKELKDAQQYLVGSFNLGLETQAGLGHRLLEGVLYDLPKDYLETYSDKVMAVTAEDVRRAARKYIAGDNVLIVVVGDSNKIKPDLDYFGMVEVWDAEGRRKSATAAESTKDKTPIR